MQLKWLLLQDLIDLRGNWRFEGATEAVFFLSGLNALGGWAEISGASHPGLDRDLMRGV